MKSDVRRVLYQAGLALIAGAFALPLIWMIAASLRTPGLPPPRTIEWLPDPIAWSNYARIFELAPLDRHALNSLGVVVVAVPITVLTASWAGFAIARLPAEDRSALLRLAVVLLMVPFTAVWLGRFLIFKPLGLIDSVWALAAPAIMGTSPFFVLLFYWTFRRLPAEMYEAARLDGASAFSAWRMIAFPLALPTATGVALLSFALYWSDFLSPLVFIKSPSLYTLPIGLQLLQQMDRTNTPLLMAASVFAIAPLIVMVIGLLVLLRRSTLLTDPEAPRRGERS